MNTEQFLNVFRVWYNTKTIGRPLAEVIALLCQIVFYLIVVLVGKNIVPEDVLTKMMNDIK